ncbi:MAG: LytTR family DNA-binding domain-containing protein [Sulfitobacter sp.]
MELSRRDIAVDGRSLCFLFLSILMCAYTAPFDTGKDRAGLALFFYWACICSLGYFVGEILARNFYRLVNPKFRPITYVVSLLVAAGVLVSATVGLFIVLMGPNHSGDPILWENIFKVFPIVLAIGVVRVELERKFAVRRLEAEEKQQAPEISDLVKRVSKSFGSDIIFARSNDHYTEIATSQTHHMELIRFRDAMTDFECLNGMQVHRSYWVAFPHISELKRNGQKMTLLLSNGEEVPVSKSYQKRVADKLSPSFKI